MTNVWKRQYQSFTFQEKARSLHFTWKKRSPWRNRTLKNRYSSPVPGKALALNERHLVIKTTFKTDKRMIDTSWLYQECNDLGNYAGFLFFLFVLLMLLGPMTCGGRALCVTKHFRFIRRLVIPWWEYCSINSSLSILSCKQELLVPELYDRFRSQSFVILWKQLLPPLCFPSWSEVIRVVTGGPLNLKGLLQNCLSTTVRMSVLREPVWHSPPRTPRKRRELPQC